MKRQKSRSQIRVELRFSDFALDILWLGVSFYIAVFLFFIFARFLFRIDLSQLSAVLTGERPIVDVSIGELFALFFCAVISIAGAIYFYLNGRPIFRKFLSTLTGVGRIESGVTRFSSIGRDKLEEIEERIKRIESEDRTGLDEDEREALFDLVVKDLRAGIPARLLSQIKKEHGEAFLREQRIVAADEKFQEVIARLSQERQRITLWTFLNLVAGVVAAGGGAYLLFQMVLELRIPDIGSEHLSSAILAFLARLSLVAIIEIFAYFFLNLYRTGLQEIKFYQNELTNISSRQAALRTALFGKDAKTLSDILRQLIATERNFILKKGQSTVAIEQNRLDQDADNRFGETVMAAVNAGLAAAKKRRGK